MTMIITEHDDWANSFLSTFGIDHLIGEDIAIAIDDKKKVSDVESITIFPKDKKRKAITLRRPKSSHKLLLVDYQRVFFDIFVDTVMARRMIDRAISKND